MIEDPFYLDKKTKVFMIGDYTTDYDNYHSKESIKQWNKLGYEVTKHDINLLKDPDFNLNFLSHIKNNRRYYFKESYTVISLLKKMRNRNTPYLIVKPDSFPYSDIKLSIKNYNFFPFYNASFNNKELLAKIYGVYLNKYGSHMLYKAMIDREIRLSGKFHIFNYLTNEAIDNEIIDIKDIEQNLSYLNAQVL